MSPSYPRVKIDFALTPQNLVSNPPDRPLDGVQDVYGDNEHSSFMYHTPEEEIAMAPACWLWDYLRCVNMVKIFIFYYHHKAAEIMFIENYCKVVLRYEMISDINLR